MTDDEPTFDVLKDLFIQERHVVQCPHCDRSEALSDQFTTFAWITAHIQEKHGDELPETVID